MLKNTMKQSHGFTLTELLITMVALGILLTLGTVSLRGQMVNARDSQRASNVESIAIAFEDFYNTGWTTDGYGAEARRTYPGTLAISAMSPSINQELSEILFPGIDTKILTAPDEEEGTISLKPATNATQTTSGVSPQPTVSQYIYQPLTRNDNLCDGFLPTSGATPPPSEPCEKFNIFFRKESDNSIERITSRR